VSKRTWGFVAGVIGSALGAWYFGSARRFGRGRAQAQLTPAREHGTVIFHNSPAPPDGEGIL